ncbi:hypothetical protein [Haloarchaeobius sp. DFWS5]|uniref:hypothetical protein n=1 Tax=Haloarchaeobius sp. DFWS5 TaxID=3446114 RepID=UPI003EB71D4E
MHTDISRNSFGLGFLVCYSLVLAMLPVVGLFLLEPDESLIDTPLILIATMLTATAIAAVLLYTRTTALETVVYDADSTETIWGELISYTAVLIATFVVTAFVFAPLETRFGRPRLISFVQFVLSTAIAATVVGLHRNGTLDLPTWITATNWGLWDFFALFAAVAALTLIYANTVFDSTSGLLSITAVFFSAIAVFLRKQNTLVAPSTPDQTDTV